MSLPKIFVYSLVVGGDGLCYALAEDGVVLGSHLCSNEGYARGDLGVTEGSRPDRHVTYKKHYPDGYTMEFITAAHRASHAGLQDALKLNQATFEAQTGLKTVTFSNSFHCVDTLSPEQMGRSLQEFGHLIAQEPMLHSASPEFAVTNGGLLTRAVMSLISRQEGWEEEVLSHESRGYYPVIDTKSVLLMEGQYAAIPGWHADGVPRGENGQPTLEEVGKPIIHYTYVGNDIDVSGTEFVLGSLTADVKPEEVWSSVNAEVQRLKPATYAAPNGSLMRFSRAALHRVGPAVARQWRYFFRLSFYHKKPLNLVRHQVNVYTDINQGW